MNPTSAPAATALAGERRRRIIDSAARCFRRFGVTKTTIDDIAAESGLSRATIYRAIPEGRDAVVLTVLIEEAQAGFDRLHRAIEPLATFEDQVVEGLAGAVEATRDDPHLAMLFTAETVASTMVLPGAWDALCRATGALVAPFTARARETGELRAGLSDEQVCEWLNRVIMSIVAFPALFVDAPAKLRAYIRTFVVPALLATAATSDPEQR